MNLTSNEWKEEIECAIPKGWWKAFGEELCEDLETVLSFLPSNAIEDFQILQIKEKFGSLRIYTNWRTKEIDKLIKKYECLSVETCVVCGERATMASTDWISPYCTNHAPVNSISLNKYIIESMKEV